VGRIRPGTLSGVIAGSVIRVELLPGPRVFDLVVTAVLVPSGPPLNDLAPRFAPNGTGRPMAIVHKQGQKSRSDRPWPRSFRPSGTVPHLPGNDIPL
jgi:hypothetical protein